MTEKSKFMLRAIELSIQSAKTKGGPFGCVIVKENKIDLNFKIKDSDKFYVERVNIFGNYNTIEEVIRNQLIVDEGDPLNQVLFNKSINKIRSLGFFSA